MSESRSALARALDAGVPTPDDAVGDRILDAALELVAASGHLTMDDVAQRAGVGRMTVYRRFADKRGLLDVLVVRETRRGLAEIERAVDAALPVERQLVEGFSTALRLAREHPLVVHLVKREPETVLAAVSAAEAFSFLRELVAARIRIARPMPRFAPGTDVDAIAEVVVRLGVSFVLLPESIVPLGDEGAVRSFASALIAPMIASA